MAASAERSAGGARAALIVASDAYQDPGLNELRAPAADAQTLAAVLSDPEIGGFDVRTLLNEPAHLVNEAVEEFLTDRSPDDLLLLHFSCHGIKDQEGELYFAMANTKLRLLGATAVAANFVNRRMNQSRSHRIVLFLDCCYAGAFDRGMTTRAAKVMDVQERFSGRGRAVITASGAVEYAFEGGQLTEAGDPAPSVFTAAMVRGLSTGEADRDQDGYVDLDELYDYVYDSVREATPHQTPGKWAFGIQGGLVIARRKSPVTEPVALPADLQHSVDSPLAGVRAGAVDELARLLSGRHQGLALAARRALEALADDDSRTVMAAASAALVASPARPQGVGQPAGLEPSAKQVDAVTVGSPATARRQEREGEPRGRRRSWWLDTGRRRLLVLGAVAALLVAGGVTTWWLFERSTTHATTIPASFDGRWTGHGPAGDNSDVEFTASLTKDLEVGQLAGSGLTCYSGPLTVSDATEDRLTMRFEGGTPADECNSWDVVFVRLPGGDLRMKVDSDSQNYPEGKFEIRMSRSD